MQEIRKYSVGHAFMYMVKGEKTILVDTGAYFQREDYLEAFHDAQIKPDGISLIVLTHGHWDHISGVHILKELTHAPVLCHANAVYALKNGDDYCYHFRNEAGRQWSKTFEKETWQNIHDANADIVITDEFDLKPYGIAGKVIPTPGHSSSSISVVLSSGDALIGDFIMQSPFDGKLILNLIADDEKLLKKSLATLLKQSKRLYDGHFGCYTAEELKPLLVQETKTVEERRSLC